MAELFFLLFMLWPRTNLLTLIVTIMIKNNNKGTFLNNYKMISGHSLVKCNLTVLQSLEENMRNSDTSWKNPL